MSTSVDTAIRSDVDPSAVDINFSETTVRLVLSDGGELAAPLAWFPRLRNAAADQRAHCGLIGHGHGIHWPDIDEDISVRALLGHPT